MPQGCAGAFRRATVTSPVRQELSREIVKGEQGRAAHWLRWRGGLGLPIEAVFADLPVRNIDYGRTAVKRRLGNPVVAPDLVLAV